MTLKESHILQLMYGTITDPSAKQFSRLNDLDQFRNKDDRNRFHFALRYPYQDQRKYYDWKQNVNPYVVEGE